MSSESQTIPRRLAEVGEWKEQIYREVAHLPLDQALSTVLEKARDAAHGSGLSVRTPKQLR